MKEEVTISNQEWTNEKQARYTPPVVSIVGDRVLTTGRFRSLLGGFRNGRSLLIPLCLFWRLGISGW